MCILKFCETCFMVQLITWSAFRFSDSAAENIRKSGNIMKLFYNDQMHFRKTNDGK